MTDEEKIKAATRRLLGTRRYVPTYVSSVEYWEFDLGDWQERGNDAAVRVKFGNLAECIPSQKRPSELEAETFCKRIA